MPRSLLASALLTLLAARCGGDDTGPDSDGPGWEPARGLALSLDERIGAFVHASWEQLEACEGSVASRVVGEDWAAGPSASLAPGAQDRLVPGLPYGAEVELRLELDCGGVAWASAPVELQTDPLPEGLPHAAVLSGDPERWDPSLRYLLTSIDSRQDATDPEATWTVILDRQGRTVWALPTPAFRVTMSPRVGSDGRSLLIDHNSFWAIFDAGQASQVLRVDLQGEELERYDTPGLHHPFTELPDGGIAWGSADGMTETLELLDPAGERSTLWSCLGFHQQVGSMLPCSANTVTWSEARQSFLVSFFSTDSVVELDSAGALQRWFGHLPGSWAFDPPDSAFYWQHGTNFTPDGTLLLSTADGEPGSETLAREYRLDEDSQTLVQVWSFGAGQGIYGDELGEAWRLPGGNTLHNTGTAQRIREITPEGAVVWDLSWSRGSFVGRSEPIESLYDLLPE
jgi:hypothetical protein